MSLFTLNGALLVEQAACESTDDGVLDCVFYEGVNNEWLERELLFTGHKRGVVNVSGRRLCYLVSTDISRFGARLSATDDSN